MAWWRTSWTRTTRSVVHVAMENADAHSEKYLRTSPYPLRDPKGEVRVMYALRPTRILTFGPVEG